MKRKLTKSKKVKNISMLHKNLFSMFMNQVE
jgi:hypothetical protein